jgi:ATP-binding cassette subfamily B protein
MATRMSSLQRATASRLIACIRPYWVQATLGLAAHVLGGAIVLSLGQGVRNLVDHGLHGHGPSGLRWTAVVMLGLVLLYGASACVRAYLSAFLGDRVSTDLSQRVLARLLDHGPGFFELEGTGLLWSRVSSDLEIIRSLLVSVVTALRNGLIVVGGLVAMMATGLALTAMVLVLAPVITGALFVLGARTRRLADATQHASARANAFALEAVDGIRVIKAFSQERLVSDRFAGLADATLRLAVRRSIGGGLFNGAATCLIFGSAVLLVWVAGEQVIGGRLSEGQASAFMVYALLVGGSGAGLSDTWGQVQKGIGAAERVFALIDRSPTIRAPAEPRRLAAGAGAAIAFERVTFRYPTRPEVAALDRLDLSFEAGAVTALVGPSGAGKSTVFQLLLRLYDPDEGRVCIGGCDLRQLDPADLRAQIALVPQEPTLFEGDLRENIRFGRRGASDREVEAAAEAAQAMEFISRLPGGMLTEVGPRGAQLSGGQRQRIAIARAILRDPRILLLDEATNALDAQSEALAHMALTRLAKGRTTLIIAHKLATVRSADTIMVMDQGRLVSRGAHADLLAEGGLYARFADLQLI